MYSLLAAFSAGFWVLSPDSPEFTGTWRRAFLGSLVTVLVIIAASVLTRMRLEYLGGIEQLERNQKTA